MIDSLQVCSILGLSNHGATGMEIKSYFVQLAELASSKDADLKEAFLQAGVPDSTYYRVLNGRDLHYRTALKVACALSQSNQEASVFKEHSSFPDGGTFL